MKAMRSLALASAGGPVLISMLAASCTAPDPRTGFTRYTIVLPPGCSRERAAAAGGRPSDCMFTTPDGRDRVVRVDQWVPAFKPSAQSPLQADPEGFWALAVRSDEARAASKLEPGSTLRRSGTSAFPPPPGAKACVWFVYDLTFGTSSQVASDMQGARCLLYDPATDRVEEFMLSYFEFRRPGTPADPDFEADAKAVARSVRFAPPDARP